MTDGQAGQHPQDPGERAAAAGALLRPLLTLSHDLAAAREEAEVCGALARALSALFPGRHHAVRLLDPRTLALTAFRAAGPLRPRSGAAVVLRRGLAEGLDPAALAAGGVALAEADEPLFDGSAEVLVAPLVVDGALHGLVNLEYPAGAAGTPAGDAPVLEHLAGQAALGVRNLRNVEELGSLKTYLEQLIEHANALIAVADVEQRVTVWNAALVRLTGIPAAEALGKPLPDFAADEEEKAILADLLERTRAGEPVDGHEVRLRAGVAGEPRVVFNTAPVRGATGEVEGVVAIGQDLTRLRNLEAAAEQAEKMAGLGRLAAGIVHELNNPLVAVTMYSEALYEKWAFSSGDKADLEKIKAIKEAGQRIQKLTRDLTLYARGGTSKAEATDLGPLLDQAARMCKAALKETNSSVERAFAEVPQVVASRSALVQAFVNLITNAAQALPKEGGVIRLGLAAEGGRVVATVADDGIGMGPAVAARAFEPFFTTRPGRGIGLGLATARGIVERYGGTIGLVSAAGEGTTMSVSLPAKPPA